MHDIEREKRLYKEAGLDPEVAAAQVERVRNFREGKKRNYFNVIEPATPENRGIYILPEDEREASFSAGRSLLDKGLVLSVVLAAGESRRYLKGPSLFYEALKAKERGEEDLAGEILAELSERDGDPVPEGLRPGSIEKQPFYPLIPADILNDLEKTVAYIMGPEGLDYAGLPKAFTHAALLNGEPVTYFELKLLGARALNPKGSILFIIQEKHLPLFEDAREKAARRFGLEEEKIIFDFQSARHATVRIDKETGRIAEMEGGKAEVGMGGHGEIARDLNRILPERPEEAILLTNVDNLIGSSPAKVRQQAEALGLFSRLRERAAAFAREPDEAGLDSARRLLEEVFHTTVGPDADVQEIAGLLARPLTVMGMVENVGKDVGGGPFFIEEEGKRVKICAEGPHLSPEDQEKLTKLAGTSRGVTHFNPVFVIREVKRDGEPLAIAMNPDYFIVTERLTGHLTTLHHETVLWEMVGNSRDSNLVFLEMQRGPSGIFNPSKSFADAMGRHAEEIGYETG